MPHKTTSALDLPHQKLVSRDVTNRDIDLRNAEIEMGEFPMRACFVRKH